MMYYSSKARHSAIKSIHELNKKIAKIPGNHLSYEDAQRLQRLLNTFEESILSEERQYKSLEEKDNIIAG